MSDLRSADKLLKTLNPFVWVVDFWGYPWHLKLRKLRYRRLIPNPKTLISQCFLPREIAKRLLSQATGTAWYFADDQGCVIRNRRSTRRSRFIRSRSLIRDASKAEKTIENNQDTKSEKSERKSLLISIIAKDKDLERKLQLRGIASNWFHWDFLRGNYLDDKEKDSTSVNKNSQFTSQAACSSHVPFTFHFRARGGSFCEKYVSLLSSWMTLKIRSKITRASLQAQASKMISFEKRDKTTSDFIASISRWRAVRLSSRPAIRHVSRQSDEFRIEFWRV